MSIEEFTGYRTMGKEFNSLDKAEEFRRDQIGTFMDPVMNQANVHPGAKIVLIDWIVANRDKLSVMLDY